MRAFFLRPGGGNPVLPLLALTLLLGCDDDPAGPGSSPPHLGLALSVADARLTTDRALELANEAAIRIESAEGSFVFDTVVPLESEGDTRLRLEFEETLDSLLVAVTLSGEGFVLFEGSAAAEVQPAVLRTIPVELTPVLGSLEPAVDVALGGGHSCALNVHGQTFCWGSNSFGQTGTGGADALLVPTLVETEARFVSLSVGERHSCGLTEDGTPWCWGENLQGQLGDGSTSSRSEPGPVAGQVAFASLESGAYHVCGRAQGGEPYCWGGNGRQQIDDAGGPLGFSPSEECGTGESYFGVVRCSTSPRRVQELSTVSEIRGGIFHSCAVSGGQGWCWGWNQFSQLGLAGDTTFGHPLPQRVALNRSLDAIYAGTVFSCALDTGGGAWCWGNYLAAADTGLWDWGQFGDGAFDGQLEPGSVSGGLTFESLAVPDANNILAGNVCGLTLDGVVYCWGSNERGQLGASGGETCEFGQDLVFDCRSTPAPVSGDHRFRSLGAGGTHFCGVSDGWQVLCWGANDQGQLGDGTTEDRGAPGPPTA